MATGSVTRGRYPARRPLRRRSHQEDAARGQSGAVMVEMAIVMLVFMAMIMGVVDFGRGIAAYSTISHAAREGARAAAYYDTSTRAGVLAAIDSQLTLAPEMATRGLIEISPDPGAGHWPLGSEVEVRILYYFEAATPLIAGFFPVCGASDPLCPSGERRLPLEARARLMVQ